jgi:Tol biopolymer transport system component/predicted Ser/Thr protein kinase
MPISAGTRLGAYEILAPLGAGGMGEVYRAHDAKLGRDVALKILPAALAGDAAYMARFQREARVLASLNHPNIVTVYEIGHADGLDFIAMEYVRGKTLDHLIHKRRLRPGEALPHAVQIAGALAAAHAVGIVHRDIKPANIMICDAGGNVKVLDFGLAKQTAVAEIGEFASTQSLDHNVELQTAGGTVLGTMAYMSPEQAEGKNIDARSDIFSFGSVLYEMLTGRRAFQGQTRMSTMAAVLREEPRAASELAPGLPPELEEVIGLCLRKDRSRRLQTMADLKLLLENLRENSDAGRLGRAAHVIEQRWDRWRIAAGSLALVAALAAAWWLGRSGASATPVQLIRLTLDSGLTVDPALSPNGELLAYASDRAGEGNLDIWVQPVSGGEPTRLTQDPADDEAPSFSPDSSRIAFHSYRGGGGIYVVPALGGQERLIAAGGDNPMFSTDGARIVFWIGEPSYSAPSGKIYVVSATGSTPVQVQPGFADARYPIWTRDGKHILFEGTRAAGEEPDWWVTPAGSEIQPGDKAVRTGAFAVFRRKGISVYMGPGGFRGDQIVFSADESSVRKVINATSIYQIPISTRSWKASDKLERLTLGTGVDAEPSPSTGGRVVFASLQFSENIWSLPLDVRGQAGAAIQRITDGFGFDATPSVSRDGAKLVFTSERFGNRDVWIKDLKTGRETALTSTPQDEAWPVISADGTKVAYTVSGQATQPIYVVDARTPPGSSVPEKVCEDCGEPVDWSPDGSRILYISGRPKAVGSFAPATGKARMAQSARYDIDQAQFAPDGAWISVVAHIGANRTRIFAIPIRDGAAVSESQWIPITDGASWDDRPRWSPRGNAIYFISRRDGFECIWKQALDPATGRPAGPPVAVHHFHSTGLSIMHMGSERLGLSVAEDKLAFNLLALTGNLWMIQTGAKN